ncbi:integrase [Escherichia coli]|nr:integrase [Escherichia coli]
MHRIDTKTAQKDKFGAGKNGFTRGNPQTGTPATDLDDDYFDMLQEELCSVVEASGASLEKGRHDQLLTALRELLLSRKNPFGDIKSDGTVKTALENLGLGEGSALPVGVPVPWPTATPPAGWLQCNGATFTKEQYPVLARVYPTLRLPDLRGEFIRGWDDGRKIDEGRKLLSWQKGTLVGGHDDNDSSLDISYMSNGNNIDYGGDKVFAGNYRSDYLWYAILGGTNSRAKAELNGAFFNITRPRNIAFNYIVRAA